MTSDSSRRFRFVIIFLTLLLLGMIFVSLVIGRYPISLQDLYQLGKNKILGESDSSLSQVESIFFNVRLPRILVAALAGCCLSAAGAAYQGVFRNPLASPDILGASNGAAFGAALALLFNQKRSVVMLSAFFFSLFTVFIIFLISSHIKGNRILGLILAGMVVSSLFQAGTSFVKLVADPNNQLPSITYWLMGSFAKTKPADLAFIIFPMALGLIPLLLLRWRINLLTLDDDEAATLGVKIPQIRITVILCATLITSASVAVSGMVGWIGLIIPHLMRRFTGNNFQYLLPASMLAGASFLLLVDNLSRNLMETEIPISIITAFVGAPLFLFLISRKEEIA